MQAGDPKTGALGLGGSASSRDIVGLMFKASMYSSPSFSS